MDWCGLWACMLRGVVVSLRLHPPPKQYSFGVLIKRIIESAELAIGWVEAQREEIQDLCSDSPSFNFPLNLDCIYQ